MFGGVPQGSILGVFVFNVTTDELEDEDEESTGQAWSSDGADGELRSSGTSDEDEAEEDNGGSALAAAETEEESTNQGVEEDIG